MTHSRNTRAVVYPYHAHILTHATSLSLSVCVKECLCKQGNSYYDTHTHTHTQITSYFGLGGTRKWINIQGEGFIIFGGGGRETSM